MKKVIMNQHRAPAIKLDATNIPIEALHLRINR
jgi:hypothetical protein